MNIQIEKEDTNLVISISNRIDAVASPELERRLLDLIDKGEKRLIIDLHDVDFISSAGLRVFLMAAKLFFGKGKLVIARPQKGVKNIFRISGFGSIVPIVDDLKAARDEVMKI
jgi:anti-sigma B factor antagonist